MLILLVACAPEPVEPVYDGTTGGPLAEGDVELVLSSSETAVSGTASAVLYGFDAHVADVVATPVEAWEWPVDGLPHAEVLDVPDEPWTLIDQGQGDVAEEDARFYFGRVRVNADGALWSQDLDASPLAFFSLPPPETVEITLKPPS